MEIQVHREEVPFDDQWHPLTNVGADVLHVDTRHADVVELWVERHFTDEGKLIEYATKWVRVFGTGHVIQRADFVYHAGSVVHRDGGINGHLVWHVYVSTRSDHRDV